MSARERLFGWQNAFDHPLTFWVTVGAVATILVAVLLTLALSAFGAIGPAVRRDVLARCKSWAILAPLLIVPVLAGAAWTIAGVALLSLLCYREFARATGLFREKLVSLVVVLGILLVHLAVVDHWYGFFVALFPLTVAAICIVATLPDQPKGYIQRVALGVFGFALFGSCLGHLGYMANDAAYRPLVLLVLVSVELNDVFAYCAGRAIGRRRVTPNTSPNKTLGGYVGALALTTALVYVLSGFVFAGTALDDPARRLVLGLIVSATGQFGDLVLSSIKRDLGVKDIGTVLPGMGGLLDRFDSLLLVSPAVFHYVGYFLGIGADQRVRLLTGP